MHLQQHLYVIQNQSFENHFESFWEWLRTLYIHKTVNEIDALDIFIKS